MLDLDRPQTGRHADRGAGRARRGPRGPAAAAAAGKTTLVLGVDISDTRTFDPARQFEYSPPITMRAVYETLITLTPGDYVTLKPLLAESWKLVDGGKAWEFKLRKGVKFASGNPLTAADVKFSFERLANLKDQPADMAENLGPIEVVDPQTVRIAMADKTQPLLTLFTSVTYAVYDSKTVIAQGGTSGKDAEKADKATTWLDTHSAGTGPYVLTGWTRNQEVVLERNKSYWRAPAAFEKVVLRHIADGAAQVLAVRRGDIDAALNLSPDQLDSLAKDANLKIVSAIEPRLHVHDAHEQRGHERGAREEGGPPGGGGRHRLRRDHQGPHGRARASGRRRSSRSGWAARPRPSRRRSASSRTSPRPRSSSPRRACRTASRSRCRTARRRSRGTSYDLVAQKIQSDLARVGITVELDPMDQATLRTAYKEGKTQSVLTLLEPGRHGAVPLGPAVDRPSLEARPLDAAEGHRGPREPGGRRARSRRSRPACIASSRRC